MSPQIDDLDQLAAILGRNLSDVLHEYEESTIVGNAERREKLTKLIRYTATQVRALEILAGLKEN